MVTAGACCLRPGDRDFVRLAYIKGEGPRGAADWGRRTRRGGSGRHPGGAGIIARPRRAESGCGPWGRTTLAGRMGPGRSRSCPQEKEQLLRPDITARLRGQRPWGAIPPGSPRRPKRKHRRRWPAWRGWCAGGTAPPGDSPEGRNDGSASLGLGSRTRGCWPSHSAASERVRKLSRVAPGGRLPGMACGPENMLPASFG